MKILEQEGFSKGYNIVDQAFPLTALIYINHHKTFHVAFIDFWQAFDIVSRNKLRNLLEEWYEGVLI